MSIDDKAETKAFEICPTKITGVRLACMYEAINDCRCDKCGGLGIWFERSQDRVVICPMYEKLCREYYK